MFYSLRRLRRRSTLVLTGTSIPLHCIVLRLLPTAHSDSRWPSHNFSYIQFVSLSFFRHLYLPMVRAGYSRLQAQIVVFFLSAFFHEVSCTIIQFHISSFKLCIVLPVCYFFFIFQFLISVPLRMAKLWAFSAMLAQVSSCYCPAFFISDRLTAFQL